MRNSNKAGVHECEVLLKNIQNANRIMKISFARKLARKLARELARRQKKAIEIIYDILDRMRYRKYNGNDKEKVDACIFLGYDISTEKSVCILGHTWRCGDFCPDRRES
jgi:hypothetical protein